MESGEFEFQPASSASIWALLLSAGERFTKRLRTPCVKPLHIDQIGPSRASSGVHPSFLLPCLLFIYLFLCLAACFVSISSTELQLRSADGAVEYYITTLSVLWGTFMNLELLSHWCHSGLELRRTGSDNCYRISQFQGTQVLLLISV